MRRRGRDGFTLLELLLAVSLISIITGAILGGLHLGRRVWETAKASEAIDDVEGAGRAIVSQIAKSFPAAIVAADQTQIVAFNGAADGVRFVTLSEGGAQWGGLILTEIGGENLGDRADLSIWTRVFRGVEGLTPQRAAMTRTTVVKDVASLQLAYFGVLDKDRTGWTSEWRNRQTLPKLVSVKLGANRIGRVIEIGATVSLRQQ